MPCPNRGRPSGLTFAAPPATAGVMGSHRLPAVLIATAGCERSDWPVLLVELVNNHSPYTKQGIPVVQMTGGEFWGQAGVPFGVNESPVDPTIVFDPTRVDGMQHTVNVLSDGVTWSQGTEPEIAVSRGRRSDRRLHRLEDPTAQCEGRGR